MRLLITGRGGKAGSWQVRAVQLGEAMGAEVHANAELARIRAAQLVVVVKRTPAELIQAIRRAGRPWVYDIVDAWPQPPGNAWERDFAVRWLRGHLAELKPTAVVFPTVRMRVDSAWAGPALVLEHHAWPKYVARASAPTVRVVGYEGDVRYLGRWAPILTAECEKRRWRFEVNGGLEHADIGIALRDVPGYPAGAWKSNCKLANLQALGLPALCSPEAGYREFGSGAEWFIESRDDVSRALGALAHVGARARASEAMQAAAPRLTSVAGRYRAWLETLRS